MRPSTRGFAHVTTVTARPAAQRQGGLRPVACGAGASEQRWSNVTLWTGVAMVVVLRCSHPSWRRGRGSRPAEPAGPRSTHSSRRAGRTRSAPTSSAATSSALIYADPHRLHVRLHHDVRNAGRRDAARPRRGLPRRLARDRSHAGRRRRHRVPFIVLYPVPSRSSAPGCSASTRESRSSAGRCTRASPGRRCSC